MSSKISDNEFAFFFFFQQWFTQLVRVLVGFFLFLRPIDGQRLDGCVSFVIEQDSLLWQIWSKKLSGKPDSIPSRRGCNIVAGQPFFHSAIHNYNCPQLSLIFMQLMLRYNYREKSLHKKSVLSSRCYKLNIVEMKTLASLLTAFSFPLCDGKSVRKYTLDGKEPVRMFFI